MSSLLILFWHMCNSLSMGQHFFVSSVSPLSQILLLSEYWQKYWYLWWPCYAIKGLQILIVISWTRQYRRAKYCPRLARPICWCLCECFRQMLGHSLGLWCHLYVCQPPDSSHLDILPMDFRIHLPDSPFCIPMNYFCWKCSKPAPPEVDTRHPLLHLS